jgi:hypothetical protein
MKSGREILMNRTYGKPVLESDAAGSVKPYEKPVLVRRERLSAVTAETAPSMFPVP